MVHQAGGDGRGGALFSACVSDAFVAGCDRPSVRQSLEFNHLHGVRACVHCYLVYIRLTYVPCSVLVAPAKLRHVTSRAWVGA